MKIKALVCKVCMVLAVWFSLFNNCYAQAFTWVNAGYAIGDNRVNALSAGNGVVTVAGRFDGNLTFDTFPFSASSPSAFVGQFSTTGTTNWLKQGLSARDGVGASLGKAVSVDKLGNSYVAYIITYDTYFNQTLITATTPTLVLIKYSMAGSILWVKSFNSDLHLDVVGLTLCNDDTCYLALSFAGQLMIDNTRLNSSKALTQSPDGLLLSLNTRGDVLWTKQVRGSFGNVLTSISADAAGNLLVAGHFEDQITLSPEVSFSGSGGHLFIGKYSVTGMLQWAQRMGGASIDVIHSITADAAGNVGACGSFGAIGNGQGNANAVFGTTAFATAGNSGMPDGFVTVYNAQGRFQWAKAFQGPAYEVGYAIIATKKGDFIVSGSANAASLFGPISVQTGNGSDEGFIAKYNASGVEQWVSSFGSPGADYFAATALAIDELGAVYVGGAFNGTKAQFGNLEVNGQSRGYTPFVALIRDNQALSSEPISGSRAVFSLYPNPSSGLVQVTWPVDLKPVRLCVYDMLGRLIYKELLSGGETGRLLELSAQPTGIYIIKLQTNNKGTFTRRLIVK